MDFDDAKRTGLRVNFAWLRASETRAKDKEAPAPSRTEAQQEATEKMAALSTTSPERAKMVYEHGTGPSNGASPAIRGGTPPPTAALPGGALSGKKKDIPTAKRRTFGLRAMEM